MHKSDLFPGSFSAYQKAGIICRPGECDFFQSCKNVLASDRATMNTKPQLEIWADDVKCSHGTTTGQLSEEALFYMRSRGISADAARTLLLLAFVQQVIDKVDITSLRDHLSAKIISKIEQSWIA